MSWNPEPGDELVMYVGPSSQVGMNRKGRSKPGARKAGEVVYRNVPTPFPPNVAKRLVNSRDRSWRYVDHPDTTAAADKGPTATADVIDRDLAFELDPDSDSELINSNRKLEI